MLKQDDGIGWTDVLFIPAALALSYLLGRWLPRPLAIALSLIAALLFFSLFERREGNRKKLIIAILVGTIITFTLALFNWPP